MKSLLLSLFVFLNIVNLLASPINDVDSIFSTKQFQHRRSIDDNHVGSSKYDSSEDSCSNLFTTTCNKKDFGVLNDYDLKKNINEQTELFMQPLNYLLTQFDANRGKGLKTVEIEQLLFIECMTLGETDYSESTESINEDNEFNENENQEQYYNDEDNDNDIDDNFEKNIQELREEMKKMILDSDKSLEENDNGGIGEKLEPQDESDIEPEVYVKTAHEIIKERFNDIFSVFDSDIYNRFNDSLTWQELDQHLVKYGFGHTFFNIRVATNPTNPKQNIIVLEPLRIDDWNSKKLNDVMVSLYIDIQKEIYNSCGFENEEDEVESVTADPDAAFIESDESTKDDKTNDDDEEEEIPEVCESLKDATETKLEETIIIESNRQVIYFYNSVLQYLFEPVDVTSTESSFTLSTLKRLNSILGYRKSSKHTKIDWSQIVIDKFKKLNISLDDNEIILIRNKPYFVNLKNALADLDNEAIVHAIRSKFIAENIRYYDWNKGYSLNPVDKSSFCIKQTKLYGISNLLLFNFQQKYLKPDASKADKILHNLISVFHQNISKTDGIRPVQKVQLRYELKAITRQIFGEMNRTLISTYYGDFVPTGDYFVDIINYNNMLETKNLKTLKQTIAAHANVPFSINEMSDPRNRFILHAIINFIVVRKMIPPSVTERETYYATYGVNVASFLYSLLREEKFGFVDATNRNGVEWLIPQISYSPETLKCFIPENIIDYGYDLAYSTVTDIYGVRFAHAALLHDAKSNSNSSQEFIKAYVGSQCNARKVRKVKKVLSEIEDMPALFSCTNENKICDKPAFRL